MADGSGNVVDAYPLFHTPLLSPSLSVGLDLVESNMKEGEKIEGFYEFMEGSECVINRLGETIPQLKGMKMVQVGTDNGEMVLRWEGGMVESPEFDMIKKCLVKGEHHRLIDMDAHFEDISLDFTNTYLQ